MIALVPRNYRLSRLGAYVLRFARAEEGDDGPRWWLSLQLMQRHGPEALARHRFQILSIVRKAEAQVTKRSRPRLSAVRETTWTGPPEAA